VDRLTAELTELKEKNELDTSTIKELQARADPVPYTPELHAVPHTARVRLQLSPATSAPGLGPPRPHLHRGPGSALPHLHRDWAHPGQICTGDRAHPGHICTGDWAHRRMTPGFACLMRLRLHCTQRSRSRVRAARCDASRYCSAKRQRTWRRRTRGRASWSVSAMPRANCTARWACMRMCRCVCTHAHVLA
jgi:hypothetical protein